MIAAIDPELAGCYDLTEDDVVALAQFLRSLIDPPHALCTTVCRPLCQADSPSSSIDREPPDNVAPGTSPVSLLRLRNALHKKAV